MRKGIRNTVLLIALLLVVGGCAGTAERPAGEGATSADAQGYIKSAQNFEKQGDLVNALKQYKLARTVDPNNQKAVEGVGRVEKALQSSAEAHYAAGLDLHKKGKYAQARQEFLATLRLWPDHKGAAEMLTTKKRTYKVKRFVVHVLQPGESISILAKKYYGDYHKFPIIAEYNKMKDATKVFPGQEIKVPEVEGLPFHVEEKAVKTEEAAPGEAGAPGAEPEMVLVEEKEFTGEGEMPGKGAEAEVTGQPGPAPEEAATQERPAAPAETPEATGQAEEAVDQMAIYRDAGIAFYKDKNYEAALVEFDKVLMDNPEDAVALEYAYKTNFEYAMELMAKQDYLSARDRFAGALKYKSDCQKCHGYIQKCEITYKEVHYKRGMQYFDNEKLEEAIREWKLVSTQDPDYKKVDYLIKKAETILKKVEELKGKGQ